MFPSSTQLHGDLHEVVSNVQFELHFNVPVYATPRTPVHVAPPKEPSHFSDPSLILLPHSYAQSESFWELHPTGQNPSLLIHVFISGWMHFPFEHMSAVPGLSSSHCEVSEQKEHSGIEMYEQSPSSEHVFSVHGLLSSHWYGETQWVHPSILR